MLGMIENDDRWLRLARGKQTLRNKIKPTDVGSSGNRRMAFSELLWDHTDTADQSCTPRTGLLAALIQLGPSVTQAQLIKPLVCSYLERCMSYILPQAKARECNTVRVLAMDLNAWQRDRLFLQVSWQQQFHDATPFRTFARLYSQHFSESH